MCHNIDDHSNKIQRQAQDVEVGQGREYLSRFQRLVLNVGVYDKRLKDKTNTRLTKLTGNALEVTRFLNIVVESGCHTLVWYYVVLKELRQQILPRAKKNFIDKLPLQHFKPPN